MAKKKKKKIVAKVGLDGTISDYNSTPKNKKVVAKVSLDGDIAPIKQTTTTKKKDDRLFSAFDDGYDFGDVSKTIAKVGKKTVTTAWDKGKKIGTGLVTNPIQTVKSIGVSTAEGIDNTINAIDDAGNDFFDWLLKREDDGKINLNIKEQARLSYASDEEKKNVLKQYAKDYGTDSKEYKQIREFINLDVSKDPTAIENILNPKYYLTDTYKAKQEGTLSEEQEEIYGIGQQIGEMLPSVGLSMINPALGSGTFFVKAQQNYTDEAKARGYSGKDARTYGLIMGGAETLVERLGFDQLGGLSKLSKGNVLRNMAGEGLEEFIMPYIDSTVKSVGYGEKFDLESSTEEAIEGGVMGAFTSLIMSSGGKGLKAVDNFVNKVNTGQQITQEDFVNAGVELQENDPNTVAVAMESVPKVVQQEIQKTQEQNQVLKQQNYQYVPKETDSIQRKTISEDASKYANNTPRTQEFIDLTVNISEASGVNFRLANNEAELIVNEKNKLIEKYAKNNNVTIEEATKRFEKITIDAYNNGEIVINIDSPKALNRLVGHEVTHSLEGTKEYSNLQRIATEYAKTKGEYDTRISDLQALYEGTNANIDNELTSDLIGDYLFTDQEFINNIHTQDKNLFQRIYDEIKHLIKMATAGSKEARQLEQLKHSFEKAMRENKTTSNTTVQSNVATVEAPIIEQQEIQTKEEQVTKRTTPTQAELDNLEDIRQNKSGSEYADAFYSLEKKYGKANLYKGLNSYKTTGKALEYSLSDNKGRNLSKEQQDYFKNSKVRDENGNLLQMYHGSTADFTVFDKSKIGSATGTPIFGKGFYFTNRRSDAKGYSDNSAMGNGKVYKTYLNITNPYIATDNDIGMLNTEELIKQGYDGVEVRTGTDKHYVAFEPNQIKNVDNLNPTLNDDIRYSLSNTDNQGRELSKEQQEFFKDSKVRDENGNLKTMYHGTPYGGFTVFDERNIGTTDEAQGFEGSFLGEGFYFTGSEEFADEYTDRYYDYSNPEIKEVYLDVKNPYIVPDGLDYDYGMLFDEFGVSNNKDLTSKLKERGYDGVFYKDDVEIVVFSPNQIKNVDNLNPTSDPDIRYSLSEDTSIDDKINSSMTMDEAKDMVQRIFVLNDIKNWYEDKYQNGDEWLAGEGVEEVEMYAENTELIQTKFLNKLNDKNNGFYDDYYLSDILTAYQNGTLTGEIKQDIGRIDVSKDTGYKDNRFYAPKDVTGGIEVYEKASQRLTEKNRQEVTKARADFIINAHNKGYIESLGLTEDEVKRRLKNWADYPKKAMELSQALNENVSKQNQWTGLENSSVVNTASISNEDMAKMVRAVKGDSNGWQRHYITSTMLALDTHIDYSTLTIDFEQGQALAQKRASGDYDGDTDVIRIGNGYQNTVAHEIGHYIDYHWGNQLFGKNDTLSTLAKSYDKSKFTTEQIQFLEHFNEFQESIERVGEQGDTLKYGSSRHNAYWQKPTEVFARFVGKFTEWVKNQATNNRFGYEEKHYSDRFTEAQYREFVKILQEKSALDTTTPKKYNVFNQDLIEAIDSITEAQRQELIKTLNAENTDDLTPQQVTEKVKKIIGTDTFYKVGRKNIRNLVLNNFYEEEASNLSLSNENTDIAPTSGDIFGSEIKLQQQVQEAIAPLQETIQELNDKITTLQENIAPTEGYTDEDISLSNQRNVENLEAQNIAPIEDTSPDVAPTSDIIVDPFEERDIKAVGNRKVNAYMYENPEVKPFFQQSAREMLGDLQNSIKGEKVWIQELNPATGLYEENMVTGTQRLTTDDIAELLDTYHYTYAQIEKGLNAIIEDNGKENNAVSKRIEFMLNDRLMNGYKSVDGFPIPPNEEYRALIRNKNIQEYTDQAYQEWNKSINQDNLAPTNIDNVSNTNIDEEIVTEESIRQRIRKQQEDFNNEIANENHPPLSDEYIEELIQQSIEWARDSGKLKETTIEAQNVPLENDLAPTKVNTPKTQKQTINEPRIENVMLADPMESLTRQAGRQVAETMKYTKGKPRITKTKKQMFGDAWGKFREQFFNSFHSVDKFAKDTGNQQIKFNTDMYNNVYAEINGELTTAQTDSYGNPIGEALLQPFEEAKASGEYEQLNDYLMHYSNIDRHLQGKGSVVPLEYSRKMIAEYDKANPNLNKYARRVWRGYKNDLANMQANGLISGQFNMTLQSMYPHYSPFMFVQDFVPSMESDGVARPKKVIKRAEGGAFEILEMEEARVRYTQSVRSAIRKNDVLKEIVKTSKDKISIGADTRLDPTDINQGMGIDEKGNYFATAFVNGQMQQAVISEDMYKELMQEGKQSMRAIEDRYAVVTKPLQWLSSWRRNILTTLSPTFMITNPIKDIQDASFNSKYTKDFMKYYPTAVFELGQAKTDLAKQFLTLYGSGNSYGEYTETTTRNQKNNKFVKNVVNAVPNFNNLVELAPRFAEFKASLDNGCNIQEAMYNAREVTINFGRGGYIAKALNRNGFTFLNASLQGFDKLARNFSGENGAKGVVGALSKVAILGVAPALFNALAFGVGDDEDEDYKALPDYIKDNYYLIKTGNGEFIRIPKGRMLSIFGSAGRRTLEYMQGEKDAFEGYLTNAYSQVGVQNPLESNVFAPFLQAFGSKEGKTWYGTDLVPTRLQDVPAEEQYDESTDEFSKWLGQQLGISPYKINYVLDQYTGGIGDIVLPMITEEATSDGNLLAPIKDKFTANTTFDNKYVSGFYGTKDEMEIRANSSKATEEDILKSKYLSSVSWEMSELYKEKREVQSNSDLSKAEKYEKVQKIQEQINSLAEEGLNNYENINKTSSYAIVGDREFYKDANDEWRNPYDDELEELNSLGMDLDDKSSYFEAKNGIYLINEKYRGTEDTYQDRKQEIIEVVRNSTLNTDYKSYLYGKYYAEDTTNIVNMLGINFDAYLDYESQYFVADKDEAGKSISGSKKKKVFNYINSMNIGFEEKLILAKLQYNSYDEYNHEIINYLNNSNVTYDEMVFILKQMGFTVTNDGNIYWD